MPHRDVAFVIRHLVQEVAVHHWDDVNATGGTGGTLTEGAAPAADAVDEFLHGGWPVGSGAVDPALLKRFRALTCTD